MILKDFKSDGLLQQSLKVKRSATGLNPQPLNSYANTHLVEPAK